MAARARLGHVALVAKDPLALGSYYQELYGFQEVDRHGQRVVSLSTRPDEEYQELTFTANPRIVHLAFRVGTPGQLKSLHADALERGIPMPNQPVNHGVSLNFVVNDPEGNLLEIFWPTGSTTNKDEPLDLSLSEAELANLVPKVDSAPAAKGSSSLKLGHVAWPAEDPVAQAQWYSDFLGLSLVCNGETPDSGQMYFLSGRQQQEHHELTFIGKAPMRHVALRVTSLAEFRRLRAAVEASGTPILRQMNHGVSLAFFAPDPEGNLVEIYWPTGYNVPQPAGVPLDLSLSDAELIEQARGLVPVG